MIVTSVGAVGLSVVISADRVGAQLEDVTYTAISAIEFQSDDRAPAPVLRVAMDSIWLGTRQGAWKVPRTGAPTKIINEPVDALETAQGIVWITTSPEGARTDTLWRITPGRAPAKILDGFTVAALRLLPGSAWLEGNTPQGRTLWRLNADDPPRLVLPTIVHSATFQGGLWATTSDGLWRIPEIGDPSKVLQSPARALSVVNGAVWAADERRLWRLPPSGVPESILDASIGDRVEIEALGDNVVVATSDAIWKIDVKGTPTKLMSIARFPFGLARTLHRLASVVAVSAPEGVWRISAESAPELALNAQVFSAASHLGSLWISVGERLELVRIPASGAPSPVPSINFVTGHSVRARDVMISLDDALWIGTSSALWRVSRDGLADPVLTNEILDVVGIQGAVWAITNTGLWRIRTDGHPQQVLTSVVHGLTPAFEQLWAPTDGRLLRLVPARPTFTTVNRNAIARAIERFFPSAWVAGDRLLQINLSDPRTGSRYTVGELLPGSCWSAVGEDCRTYPTSPLRIASWGSTAIAFDIRDAAGNHFVGSPPELAAFVIPSGAAWPIVVATLWLACFVVMFVASPWSTLSHGLLMNPFWRRAGYFGLLPSLVSAFAPAKNHILRRYRRNLGHELAEVGGLKGYVDLDDDLSPPEFARRLHRSAVVVRGPSGIGKTAFMYRMVDTLSKTAGLCPVYLASTRYESSGILDAAVSELARLGGLLDTELSKWLLRQGGFALFLDGFNELPEDRVTALAAEARSLTGVNAVVIATQERHRELVGVSEFQLSGFNQDEMLKFLTVRLGADEAESAIGTIPPSGLPLLSNPQNLTVWVRLYKARQSWTGTETDLYASLLDPLLQSWHHAGAEYDRENIVELAYQSWSRRQARFDAGSLTQDARTSLFEARVLTLRGHSWTFAHDRLRAYLVARRLSTQWRTEPLDQLDSNWLVPLEMLSDGFRSPDEARELCFLVLARRTDLAESLFAHVCRTRQEFVVSWQDDFYRELGRHRVGAAGI